MATKTQATATVQSVEQPIVEIVKQINAKLDSTTDLEYLRAQKRSIIEAIKQAKAASRGNAQERLAKEIETQELAPNKSLTYDMYAFVNRRVQLGQSPEEAKAAVLAICSRLIDSGLANGNPCVAWNASK